MKHKQMKGQMSDAEMVRKLLKEHAVSTGDKNTQAALSAYAPDVVTFDIDPPLAHRGGDSTDPAKWQSWFDTWDGPIAVELDQLDVRTYGDLACAYGFIHMVGERTDGSYTDMWARVTTCLERRAGAWMIVHEHQSFPTMMDGSGKAASGLKPEATRQR